MSPDTAKFLALIEWHLEHGVERPVPEYTVLVSNEYNYYYFSHQGKVDAMNYSTSIFLINDDVRALYVIFAPDGSNDGNKQQRYMVKTFDRSVEAGDYVVVPSTMGHKLAIAKVTEVDVEVDFDSTTILPWVIQRVELNNFNEMVAQEEVAIKAIRDAHFLQRKKSLAATLSEATNLRRLPLAKKRDEFE